MFDLSAELSRKHQAQLDAFSTPDTVIFWPGELEETTARAIVYRAARLEGAAPGSRAAVTRLWVALSDLPDVPDKGDELTIAGVRFVVTEPQVDDDGSAVILVRQKSS